MDHGAFGDLLDKRVTKMFYDELTQLPDRCSEFFTMDTSKDSFEKWSSIGELGDFTEFNGAVPYGSQAQGYDVVAEHREFANGFQVTRKMYDDDRHGIWERQSPALANAYMRTRQVHAARLFNNAFVNDSFFYSNSEGIALCADAHTTNASGISTASGFDNLTTSALSATAVSALRIQFRNFRGDVGNKISCMPDKLVYPIDLADRADEIIKSVKQPDTTNNNYNPQGSGRWMGTDWEYLDDTNNWFMLDTKAAKKWVIWFDRIPLDFGKAEEFDSFIAKWRAYCRYSWFFLNWRWIAGAEVS
jgi:phage major head subunit gpT-like protein